MATEDHDEYPSMFAHFELPPGMKEGHDFSKGLAIEVRSNALSPGLNLMSQAPMMRAGWAGNVHEMCHSGPSPVLSRGTRINVGDRAPDFALEGTAGASVSLTELAGAPVVLHLARAVRSGGACTRSLVGMDELRRGVAEKIEDAGVRLVVVTPATLDEASEMVREWQLPYPLYVDPGCELFDAFDCGYMGPPLHGWIVLDAEGIVRYVFRTQETLELPLPMPSMDELLGVARDAAAVAS
jgi:peroxiredoxin